MFIPVQVSKERTLHTEFVDCVRWVGNLVMSKAGNGDEETARQERSTLPPNKILLWDPLELEEADNLGSRPREVSTVIEAYSSLVSGDIHPVSECPLFAPNEFLLWDPLELEGADTLGSRPREVSTIIRIHSTLFCL